MRPTPVLILLAVLSGLFSWPAAAGGGATAVPEAEPVPPAASADPMAGTDGPMADPLLPAPPMLDVMLVLDNSGSMTRSDPDATLASAVRQFLVRLGESDRFGIIIYDQEIRLALPLSNVSDQIAEGNIEGLEQLNYAGLFSDSPSGIERAIAELEATARAEARKLIIFVTDGPVETGNPTRDIDQKAALLESINAETAESGIRICAIALGPEAESEMVTVLASATRGRDYHAGTSGELPGIMERIYEFATGPWEERPAAQSPTAPAPAPVVAPAAQPPVIEVPVPASEGRHERTRSIIIVVAALILIAALIAIIFILARRGRELRAASETYVAEAYLNDPQGYTDRPTHQLGAKPIMIGRVAGKETEHLHYIVVPQSTIGRRHALIEYKDFGYWINDQGSINGTFVNDKPVTSDVRLKHGDRVRFHKFEFDFAMPEMSDSATVVSSTQFAEEFELSEEATEIKGGKDKIDELGTFDQVLDVTGGEEDSPPGLLDDEEDTVIRGDRKAPAAPAGDVDSEDETLMPGGSGPDDSGPDSGDPTPPADQDSDDETIMPGEVGVASDETLIQSSEPDEGEGGEFEPEDETLLPGDSGDDDKKREDSPPRDGDSEEDFFDPTGSSR